MIFRKELKYPLRKTCLRSDYCDRGIGLYLYQNIVVAKGPFLTAVWMVERLPYVGQGFSELTKVYMLRLKGSPCCGVVPGADKVFTLGCNDLVVVVDHQPLTTILGDKALDEITNTRLFRCSKLRADGG